MCSLIGCNDPLENISPSDQTVNKPVEEHFFRCYFPPLAEPELGYDSLFTLLSVSIKDHSLHAEGKVYLSFTVDVNGWVKDTQVIRGINNKIDQIALTSFNTLNPKFHPAQELTGTVECRMIIPISLKR
ncbi:MAG: energy transducer TonB [Bacteroidota bacterium]